MTTVGIIGGGHVGTAIAHLAIEAGYQVVISNSRGAETLADTAAALGPQASAATSSEAAAAGDIIVVAVPVKAFPHLSASALAGKTVIDASNYGPERDGPIPELDDASLTSSGLLQRHLPTSRIVKAFNTISSTHLRSLARPTAAADRSFLPIAGDSAPALALTTEFIDSIGYNVVFSGSLADSWRQETGAPAWATPYAHDSGENAIRAALAAATRREKTPAAD